MFLCDCQTSKVWEIKPTGPNARDGLGDMESRKKRGFNNHLARSGVWWAASPRVVTIGFLSTQHTSPSPSPSLTEFCRVNNLPEEVTWIYYSVWIFPRKYPDSYHISRLSL